MYKLKNFDKYLAYFSILYLVLPYFLFILGWLKFYYALPIAVVLVYSIYSTLKAINQYSIKVATQLSSQSSTSANDLEDVSFWPVMLTFLIIILWVVLSGSGAIGFQNGDYFKHNAVLSDLIKHSWPVQYGKTNYFETIDNSLLVYYMAYYLPSAVVGKLLGWDIANLSMLIWTILGVFLGVLWIFAVVRRRFIFVCILFIFFSGLDFLGYVLTHYEYPKGTLHIEFWAEKWQYTSMTTALFYVPQQVIPCWILTGLFMAFNTRYGIRRNVAFIYSLGIFWAPFVFAGLFPFVLLATFTTNKGSLLSGRDFLELLNFNNLIMAPLIVILIMIYYVSGPDMSLPHGWLWRVMDMYDNWSKLVIFYLIEFLIFALLIKNVTKDMRLWFYTAILCLFIIPFYKFGQYNDFVMRVSLPAIYVLFIFIAKTFVDLGMKGFESRLLLIFLMLGAITPGQEFSASIKQFDKKQNIFDILNIGGDIYSRQYIGDSSYTKFSYILKKDDDIENIVNYVKYYTSKRKPVDGDINRDGKTDLIGVNPAGEFYYSVNLEAWNYVAANMVQIGHGDLNRDNKADLIGIDINNKVYISYDLGKKWQLIAGQLKSVVTADLNGDGKDDIIGNMNDSHTHYSTDLGQHWQPLDILFQSVSGGDINGDGKDELFGVKGDGEIFYTLDFINWQKVPGNLVDVASCDINLDGKDDIVGIDKTNHIFYTTDLGGSWVNIPGDLIHILVGDYNGDGKCDIAGVTSEHYLYYTLDLGGHWNTIGITILLVNWLSA
ncbi:MAG: hypothetical protein L3V56_09070 [Candidatus Magnetoovum sp. WYHC-5]|nr:hypothetical protein [Candidatus Magnetoovum sp. WYHC-5]